MRDGDQDKRKEKELQNSEMRYKKGEPGNRSEQEEEAKLIITPRKRNLTRQRR